MAALELERIIVRRGAAQIVKLLLSGFVLSKCKGLIAHGFIGKSLDQEVVPKRKRGIKREWKQRAAIHFHKMWISVGELNDSRGEIDIGDNLIGDYAGRRPVAANQQRHAHGLLVELLLFIRNPVFALKIAIA
ncbi:MAG TPA: hypothetical protein VKB53_03330 [Gammaproteobacteria bacterium]|nr:hypothetical protein [Gammaproteobacteria bacterium]HKH19933.1 hypothetical protein [Gammaproteobacteria bacterium]